MEKDNISNELKKYINNKNELLEELYLEYRKAYLEREFARLFNDYINNKQEKIDKNARREITGDIKHRSNGYSGYIVNKDALSELIDLFDKDEYFIFGNSYVFLLDKQLLLLKIDKYYNFNHYGIDANKSINIEIKDINNGCNYAYRLGHTYNEYLREFYENGVTANLIDDDGNIILGPTYAAKYMSDIPEDISIYNIIKPVTFEYIISKFTNNDNIIKKKTI